MIVFKRFKIRSYEMGLVFRDREFRGLLATGAHWLLDLLGRTRVEVVSQRAPWLVLVPEIDPVQLVVGLASQKDALRVHRLHVAQALFPVAARQQE